MNRTRTLATLAVAGLALTACSPAADTATEPTASASGITCDKSTLETRQPGKLVIATGQPAYEPWVTNDAPQSGEGFEAAVAYAAAEKLGFGPEDIQWTRTTFDVAIAPGEKDFDWNIQQFSITEDREKAVDFSSSYYDVNQAIVSYAGSPIAEATALADLESAKLGAAVGSTSLDAAQQLDTGEEVAVFNDNAA
ncbi:MAG TPA: transporter substrate-binding domain-containing protein, partial [Candidatus Limnocylindrales bacterium]|nr:transporter substrate-binding domain-containing protein [Candidatus Limnocylindrales bacterium]